MADGRAKALDGLAKGFEALGIMPAGMSEGIRKAREELAPKAFIAFAEQTSQQLGHTLQAGMQMQQLQAEQQQLQAKQQEAARINAGVQAFHQAPDAATRNQVLSRLPPQVAEQLVRTMADLQKMSTPPDTATATQKNVQAAIEAGVRAGTIANNPSAISKSYAEMMASAAAGNQRPVLTPKEEADKIELTTRVKDAAEYNTGVIKTGQEARVAERNIDQALALLEEGGKTGFAEEWFLKGKRAAQALGFNVDGVTKAEQLQALFGGEVFNKIAASKGSTSDKEMKAYADFSASMGKTPEGNKQILLFAKQAYARSREIAAMVRQMRKDGKSSETDIQNAIEDYQDKNPLVIGNPDKAGKGKVGRFEILEVR